MCRKGIKSYTGSAPVTNRIGGCTPRREERHVPVAVGTDRRVMLGHRALRECPRGRRRAGAGGGLHRAHGLRSRPVGGVLFGRVSEGPQRLPDWNPAAGGIRAFYFRDPDRHPLEVLQFPAGKGDPKWARRDRLFLGIDHTAIVVSDTEASLRFYRDALGLRVAGAAENWGPEQERLNHVSGAQRNPDTGFAP